MKPLSKLLKVFPRYYFSALGLINFIACLPSGFSWFNTIVMVFFSIPAIFPRKDIFMIFGFWYALIWAYFLAVIIMWHVRYLGGAPFHSPPLSATAAFTIGYLFTGTSLLLSILLICLSAEKRTLQLS